jgi:hypothetical protein
VWAFEIVDLDPAGIRLEIDVCDRIGFSVPEYPMMTMVSPSTTSSRKPSTRVWSGIDVDETDRAERGRGRTREREAEGTLRLDGPNALKEMCSQSRMG